MDATADETVQRAQIDSIWIVTRQEKTIQQSGGWLPFDRFIADTVLRQELQRYFVQVSSEVRREAKETIARIRHGNGNGNRGWRLVGRSGADLFEEQTPRQVQTASSPGREPRPSANAMPLLTGVR